MYSICESEDEIDKKHGIVDGALIKCPAQIFRMNGNKMKCVITRHVTKVLKYITSRMLSSGSTSSISN